MRRRFGNRLAQSTCDEGAAVGVLIDDALSISYTPCSESADDHARRLIPHRTPCTECADDRARRLIPHRTPCTACANDRADKRCTPCTESATSPRARMAPLCKGLSSASCPSSSATPPPSPPPQLRPRHRPREQEYEPSAAKPSSSPPRPSQCPPKTPVRSVRDTCISNPHQVSTSSIKSPQPPQHPGASPTDP